MREIKFRGKRRDNGEWVYGDLWHYPYGSKDVAIVKIVDPINSETVGGNAVIPETIGQYTGLKDKNGKKIFEGDIVKIHIKYFSNGAEEDNFYVVKWHKGWGTLALHNIRPVQCCDLSDAKDGEVIGNIYDNPELLEE